MNFNAKLFAHRSKCYFWQSVMFSQSSEQLSASVFVVADKYNKPLRLFPKFENRLNAYVSQTGNVMICSVLPSGIERQHNLGGKTTKGCFSISNSFLDKFYQRHKAIQEPSH